MKTSPILLSILLFFTHQIYAGEVDVLAVRFQKTDSMIYTFHVTLRHADEGWNHYADRWEIVDMKGNVLATRTLQHPHVDEQPFTRSLYDVKIPAGIKTVLVMGHDLVHGYGGKRVRITLQ
jgi:hypothetical protein